MTPDCKDCQRLKRTCDACAPDWYETSPARRKLEGNRRLQAYRAARKTRRNQDRKRHRTWRQRQA